VLASPDPLLADRFEIRRLLGEGGMGAVYEAYDRQHCALVALKTLKTFSGDEVLRLKREFSTLLDLHHPNFVRYGELCSDGRSWFFTMELVDGCDIVSHVRPGQPPSEGPSGVRSPAGPEVPTVDLADVPEAASFSPRPLDEARLRATLAQLAAALDHLHRAGRVHLDVKPSNVLVEHSGRVVLLDFGISGELHQQREQRRAPGTLAYMAPEQAAGSAVSAATDLYALGVVMYQALINRLPFAGEREHVLRAKQFGPPPVSVDEPVPADLLALCLALLHPDPAARPGCADVLRVLGQRREGEPMLRVPFVGRADELAELWGFLREAQQRGLYVCVSGEPGIGKTELVREALARHVAVYPDTVVLSGRCHAQERLPYKAWDRIIDALSEHLVALRPTLVDGLRPADVGALLTVFPVLRRVLALGEASVWSVAPAELARRGGAALVQLLAAVAELAPLVLVIDDVHWADEPSLELCASLFAQSRRVTVLATSRAASSGIEARLADRVRRLELGALPDGAQLELATRLLGGASGDEASALCREAGGHPLHLIELCRDALRPGRPKARLLDSLRARAAELEPASRGLLQLVAVSGAPLPTAVLARAAGSDLSACSLRVQELCVRHLLRVVSVHGAPAVEPYHDRVREAAELELSGEQRARLHFRVGEALLEACEGELRDAELPRAAHHLQKGLGEEREAAACRLAASVTLEAVRALRRRGALASALEACVAGLDVLGPAPLAADGELGAALLRERMELRALTGELAGAEADYGALLAHAASPLERAAVHAARVPLHVYRDEFEAALAAANRGLRELSCPLPEAPGPRELLPPIATVLRRFADLGAGRVADLPRCTDPQVTRALELLANVTPTAFRTGHNATGALALLRIAQLSLRHGVSEVSAFGFAGVGMALAALSPLHRQAARCGAGALALSSRVHDPHVSALVDMVCGGFIAPWVAPADEARLLLERCLDKFTRMGDRIHVGPVVLHLAINLQLAGRSFADVELLEELVPRVAEAGDRGAHATSSCPLRALRFLSAREQDPAEFVRSADAAFERDVPASRPITCLYYHAVSKGIALYLADSHEAAARAFEAADASAEAGMALPLWAEHLFYRALTACARAEAGTGSRLAAAAQLGRVLPRARLWERHCPSSFAARRMVLSAELRALRGQLGPAHTRFVAAAREASARDNRVVAAIASWRAARCLVRAGHADASAALQRAALAFDRAGAPGLASRIRREPAVRP
jgi:predicted ATPase